LSVIRVSLDTNIWIFGLVGGDRFCEKILSNLPRFQIFIPDQVRAELERNLSDFDMKKFYQTVLRHGVQLDFERVPSTALATFKEKGLKKGDIEIGAFCEWRKIDILVSDNRDFLKALPPNQYFEVMSAEIFCERFDL
jgi:predicted nucleic acid-binding protein